MENIELIQIQSNQNNKIKLIKKLSLKKYREEEKKFTVENLTIIYDALLSGYDFEFLFITKNFIEKNKEKFDYLKKKSKAINFYLIDKRINNHYSSLDNPTGITAVYKKISSALDTKKSVIYLNEVSDPGNVGTILRTALAFDFINIIFDDKCADIYNFKTINAAKDSIFKLNVIEDKNNEWIKTKNALPVYAADAHNGISLEKFKPKKPFCLVLGSESRGISDDILNLAEKSIKINISNNIESLNVAAAGAILMYKLQ